MVEFGPFRLDFRARRLSKGSETLALAPKSFDVLAYLVQHAGRAVSREELLAAVWPDVVVSDGSLTQAVFVVRRALGESEEGSGYLATVARVGYRFSADVRAISRPEVQSAAPPLPAAVPASEAFAETGRVARRLPRGAIALGLLLFAAGVVAVRWTGRSRRREPAETSPGLLALVREIAAPPDATALLGAAGRTAVLGAPSALYLLPLDGAQAATRVPLATGEVVADRLVGSELVVAVGRDVSARDVFTGKVRALGHLPEGAPPAREGRLLAAPGGRVLALRGRDSIAVLAAGSAGLSVVLRVPAPETPNEALALSDRAFAFAAGNGAPVRVFDAVTGAPRFEAELAETRVETLALEDLTGRVAAGGAFDTVQVFGLTGGRPETFPSRGWTSSLAWIPDHPTLLAGGRLGAVAWRPGAGVLAWPAEPGNGGALAATPDAVLVLSPDRQRLAVFAYAGFPPEARVAVSKAPLWALARDPEGRTVFAGGRDGKVYAVDASSRAIRAETVHTDGVPSLLAAGDFLASSSDDKTVAVWSLPGPKLVRRVRAHDFLVNDLQLAPEAPGGAVLVTSSSDGTIKTWRWPSLEPLETVDLTPFAGGKVEAHALWTSPDASRVLVGTWDHALLDLVRADGRWTGRRLATEGGAVYRLAGLPKLGLVAGVGILPHEVFVFDLATGSRRALQDAGLQPFWAVAEPAGDAFIAVGNGGASRYVLTRASDGTFTATVVSRRQSGLSLLTAVLLPDGSLWCGSDDGALLDFPRRALDGDASWTETVAFQ
ncbi:MAG TPA: winged helix-turn-helix domain-containing protein [Thermoanaerobaculia bacterium]|nr:winged helix-turn-helix domain-containing protein [Thermoanaerobaculia bacterium]